MQLINVEQGTPEWHEHRANFFNASEAPAMLAASKQLKRDDLLKQHATGASPAQFPTASRRFWS